MIEYDHEPVRGLPGDLPEGEAILWQGGPDARVFARTALYTRWVAGYFVFLTAFALVSGSLFGTLITALSGAAAVGLLHLFASLVAKTTVYTITNRRVVLRIGVALNKCINLPLSQIGSAGMREHGAGLGDIALRPSASHRLGYAMLWPHARPLRLSNPEPMLRALPDAQAACDILAHACAKVVAVERTTGESKSSAQYKEAAA